MIDLFDDIQPKILSIAKDTYLLRGFVLGSSEHLLLADLNAVLAEAPLRHMLTKTGYAMSAAMSNCGALGWISDRSGYRYDSHHPDTGKAWPAMPNRFLQLATSAAAECGFASFLPDACLINQYKIGASMGLHQDKNELDFTQPIVSVSLGCTATFLFGGLNRRDKTIKVVLQHGDIVVWGGESRLNFHGIMPLKPNTHALLGEYRFNLTFRKAG